MSTRAMACWAMLACAAACMPAAPARANDDAHTVADKFASEPERSAAAKREADRKAEDARKREAERQADEARKEAAARRAAEALKADKDKADKAKRAKTQPGEDARIATERRKADEAEMLARARREAEELSAAEEARILAEQEAAMQRAGAELRASQAAEQARAQADALAREARRKPSAADAADADAQRALAEWSKRADATRRVVRNMKRVRQIRQARLAAQARREAAVRQPIEEPPRTAIASDTKPAAAGSNLETAASHLGTKLPHTPDVAVPVKPEPATADLRRPVEPRQEAGLRERVVTVLLVMAPGTYGIRRRGPKVADPVLCTPEGCYISTGPGTPAHFMPGRKATGFANTWGARAGACRQQLGCIFRGVDLGQGPGYLQPVDLHILRHDRRQGQAIDADSGCRVDAGRVDCNRGIYAPDYAMWVMPESMATAVGAAALERALEDGLAAPRSADLSPRPMR